MAFMKKMCISHKWKTIKDDGIYKTRECSHCKQKSTIRYKTKLEIEKMLLKKESKTNV